MSQIFKTCYREALSIELTERAGFSILHNNLREHPMPTAVFRKKLTQSTVWLRKKYFFITEIIKPDHACKIDLESLLSYSYAICLLTCICASVICHSCKLQN